MKLKQYQVDAFTDKVFGGNPAAVVPLSSWPDDSLLQAIAEENNLSKKGVKPFDCVCGFCYDGHHCLLEDGDH